MIAILIFVIQFSSVAQSSATLQSHGLQHTRLPCPPPTHGVYSDSCPLSRWCHPTISASVIPFSSCIQSFLASESFPLEKTVSSSHQVAKVLELQFQHQSFQWTPRTDLFAVQGTRKSLLQHHSSKASIQDWFTLGLTNLISLQVHGTLNTTVQKHQFFGTQLSLQSNSHIHTWLLEKP